MTHGRKDSNRLGDAGLIRYRINAPDVWEPPRSHKRIRENEYLGPYEPRFKLLDELDVIAIEDWEAGP